MWVWFVSNWWYSLKTFSCIKTSFYFKICFERMEVRWHSYSCKCSASRPVLYCGRLTFRRICVRAVGRPLELHLFRGGARKHEVHRAHFTRLDVHCCLNHTLTTPELKRQVCINCRSKRLAATMNTISSVSSTSIPSTLHSFFRCQ